MKFRSLPQTSVKPLSEVGFGLWTVSTGWWGTFTETEAMRLMHAAVDFGINFFDAADTYGNGRSEELIARAFPGAKRDTIVIATKVGYNFYDHATERRGQFEIPQNFSTDFIRRAVDLALQRLGTDHIDILQLHNIRADQVEDDALWNLLEDLRREGKILAHGAALGPAIGWLYEGIDCVQRRKPHIIQHIYNMLETHPGKQLMDEGNSVSPDTRYLVRVPHSSGMLEGRYTAETTFPPNDHRSHRPRSWLLNGLKKIETLRFLANENRTLGQAALQWLLADERIVSCLPNIYDEAQLREFATAPDTARLTTDELARVRTLAVENFGVTEEPGKFKGTMTRAAALANA